MKFVFSLLVLQMGLVSAITASARGGDIVGNGGVIWACRSGNGGQDFHAGLLTDLYEAQEQYHLTMIANPGGDAVAAYETRKAWLQANLPELFAILSSRFQFVEQHRYLVNADLLSTEDYNNALQPQATSCPQGEWKPQNFANFRDQEKQVLISASLWNSPLVPSLDKAALLFHEAVYYWLRTEFGATNSDQARHITGLLFSIEKKPGDIKQQIDAILGTSSHQEPGQFLCLMKNSKRNQLYFSYDDSSDDAALKVRLQCQNDADPDWCAQTSIECAEAQDQAPHRCLAQNSFSNKIYIGKGRGLLEAQMNAHQACYIGSQAIKTGLTQSCPDFAFMECN